MRWLGTLILLVAACSTVKKSSSLEDGFLAIEYSGSLAGRLSLPAAAAWCPGDSLLELTAVNHDTGVALSILPGAGVEPEVHPIMGPEILVDQRPRGLAAIRWVSGDSTTMAFRGTDGSIEITDTKGGRVTGKVRGTFMSMDDADTLTVTGSFSKVQVGTAEGPCGRIVKSKAD